MKKFLNLMGRFLLIFSAVWAVGASALILLTPQTIHGQVATQENGEPQTVTEFTRQLSWYQVQGLWGVIVLVIFAGLYAGAAVFLLRGKFAFGLIFAVLSLGLTLLAGFSVGLYYMPAGLALLVGMGLLGVGLALTWRNV
jgi:hypothetical protein